jgi:hypothetical protein
MEIDPRTINRLVHFAEEQKMKDRAPSAERYEISRTFLPVEPAGIPATIVEWHRRTETPVPGLCRGMSGPLYS